MQLFSVNSMRSGRHFLQIPGPTNTPERILRAMQRSVIDHRGPEFAELGLGLLRDLKPVFQNRGPRCYLSRLWHRCVGGRLGQCAATG